MGIQTAAASEVAQHTPMMQQYLRLITKGRLHGITPKSMLDRLVLN
jgi:hypothetical protein